MKYILEIKPEYEANGIMILGARDSHLYVTTLAVEDMEELNSDYINEHFGDLQDTAYQRGINDGSLDVKQRVEGAYQQGLNDAWKAAKKIFGYEIDGGIPIDKVGRVFGYSEDATFCTADIIRHNTASEAIAKLKAYEEKQKADNKIEVGDEVKPFYTDITGVVTLIDGDTIYVLWRDGSSTSTLKLKEVTKTGRHFDIASILEDMRND